jgi:hypothetical protein
MMPRVDFLISNDRHHVAMTWPVAGELAESGDCAVRVLSLCELRGLATPPAERAPQGVEVRRVLPLRLRSSPSAGPVARPGSPSLARRLARASIWRLLLAPRLVALLRRRPDLVVLPNDAAYPYDRIGRLTRRRRVQFLLLQEGIRFPLAGQTGVPVYGAGGAAAVAAWGEASGEYFRAVGVPEERIHLTGNPRFDQTADPAAGDPQLPADRPRSSRRTLLLATNPIDDQGLCSREEKLDLVGRFLAQIRPLFAEPEFHVAIKLHSRESPEEIRPLIPEALRERVSIHTDTPLRVLFGGAGAVVVLASTVGLEALLGGLPLAVLEIPGHGFQYDYVQSGAAAGLSWSAPLAPQVRSIFEPSEARRARVETYLRRQLGTGRQATRQVGELIRGLLREGR